VPEYQGEPIPLGVLVNPAYLVRYAVFTMVFGYEEVCLEHP
jgi:hypothetical protein